MVNTWSSTRSALINLALKDIRHAIDVIFLTEDLLLVARMVQDTANLQGESAIPTVMRLKLLIFSIARRHALVELEYPPMR